MSFLAFFGCTVYHNYNLAENKISEDGFRISASKYRDGDLHVLLYIDTLKQFKIIDDLKISIQTDSGKLYNPQNYGAYCAFTEISTKNGYLQKEFQLLPNNAKQPIHKQYYTCYSAIFNFNDTKTKYIIVHMEMVAIKESGERMDITKDFKLLYKRIKTPML